MTTIAVFGYTGFAGSHITAEALKRGDKVIGISRRLPAEGTVPPNVDSRIGNIHDAALVDEVAKEADVVVVALHASDPDEPLIDALPALRDAAEKNDARLAVVGGAGSLFVAPGGPRLFEGSDFLDEWKPEALAHGAVLQWLLDNAQDISWFYLSPAALFGAGTNVPDTGTYTVGGDVLLVRPDGSTSISGNDYAKAFVDEIEKPAHANERFSVIGGAL